MSQRSYPARWSRRRPGGQALIYGLFMLVAASTVFYFMVFAGNLAIEKTKLVNTADAVAYSAGVMHARALNFDASINRTMVANEAVIAQMVSMSSWLSYASTHAQRSEPLNCAATYSVPIVLGLVRYTPVCAAAVLGGPLIEGLKERFDSTLPALIGLISLAQTSLQTSQAAMEKALISTRDRVMSEVADANYSGLGKVVVEKVLLDDFANFDGGGKLIVQRTNSDRQRFKEVAVLAAYRDPFVKERRWDSKSPWPCLLPRGEFRRRGGTEMRGLDEWKAMDTSSLYLQAPSLFGCKSKSEFPLGSGLQAATDKPLASGGSFGGAYDNPVAAAMAQSSKWNYKGLPAFYELSAKALEYAPDHNDAAKRDLRIVFSVKLSRPRDQTLTPDGRARARPQGRLAAFDGAEADGSLSAVGTSEVYFERPAGAVRTDGKTELASLFNPYWQVRLRATSPATLALARGSSGGM